MSRRERRGDVLLVAGFAVVLAVALGACGGGATAGPVATSQVDMPPSYRFAPATIQVPPGTTVTWTNRDNFSHSVEVIDGGLTPAPVLVRPGETTQLTFDRSGTYPYRCSLHPRDMTGTVIVAG